VLSKSQIARTESSGSATCYVEYLEASMTVTSRRHFIFQNHFGFEEYYLMQACAGVVPIWSLNQRFVPQFVFASTASDIPFSAPKPISLRPT
jgi:hypothetical protein